MRREDSETLCKSDETQEARAGLRLTFLSLLSSLKGEHKSKLLLELGTV